MAFFGKAVAGFLLLVLVYMWRSGAVIPILPDQSGMATSTLTFQRSDTLYSKDLVYVYYKGAVVPGANPYAFKIIGRPRITLTPDDYYAADKEHVFYNGMPVKYADPDAFVFLLDKDRNPTDYAKDKDRVYNTYLGTVIKKADAESFIALNYWYGKDKKTVFTMTQNGAYDSGRFPIKGADSATFVAVADPAYCRGDCTFDAQDKNHRYLRGVIVETETSDSATIFDAQNSPTKYAKDAAYVYFDNKIVSAANLKTFAVIGQSGSVFNAGRSYAKDKKYVYVDGIVLSGADPSTFMFIKTKAGELTNFAKDKKYVYSSSIGEVVPGADPASFLVVNEFYAKDKSTVYSITPRAANNFYFVPIAGSDPNTLTVVDTSISDAKLTESCGADCLYDAKDKNHKYFRGQTVQ